MTNRPITWLGFGLGLALACTAAPALGAGPSRALRPSHYTDRFGRELEDVCPERTPGQRRCYAHRIVPKHPVHKRKIIRPASGGTSSDPNCQQQGGLGGGGSSPPAGTMTPSDVLAAYNIPSSAAAHGAIVALVEMPSPNAYDDLSAYRQQYNIPALPHCPTTADGVPTPNGTPCFARVGEDGTEKTANTDDCPGWAAETGLDLAMVSAACPDCSIVVVEGKTIDDLSTVNKVAAMVLSPAAISNSWGGAEEGPGQDDESPFNNPNTLTFVASGDSGYMDEDDNNGQIAGSDFPSSSPYVIAVGGTTLSPDGSGGYSEVVWNDDASLGGGGAGGSGCSGEFEMPSYQLGSGFSFGSCKMRASVDLAAAAEFNPSGGDSTGSQDSSGYQDGYGGGGGGYGGGGGGGESEGGIAVYDADDGGWNPLTGTSAACPLVAALMTRIGLAGRDNHALFYKNIDKFNDITQGANDNDNLCSDVMCNAGSGWDGPSGLGSPNGTLLATLAGTLTPGTADAGVSGEGGEAPDGGVAVPSAPASDAGLSGGGTGTGSVATQQDAGSFVSPTVGASEAPGTSVKKTGSSGCSVGAEGSPDVLPWLGFAVAAVVSRRRRGKPD